MFSSQLLIIGVIGVYFLAMIVIGLIAGCKESHEGFVIGNRNVGYFATIGSLASSFRDGSGIVFWVGMGLAAGYGMLWLFFGVTAAGLLYILCGPKVRKVANEKGYITIGEMVRHAPGPLTEKATSLLILLIALLGIAMQLYISGNLVAQILHFPAWIGIFSVAGVVGIYLYAGGYGTVVRTDAIQFILILSLIVMAFINPPPQANLMDFHSLVSPGIKDIVAMFLFGALLYFSVPDGWQRVFSARSDRVVQVSFFASGLFIILMTLSLIFLGMSAKSVLGDIEPNNVFFALFSHHVFSDPALAFIALVTMAITMSTLDTYCYLFAASLSKNFLSPAMTDTREKYVRLSRLCFVVVLITMSILALTISDVIQYLFKLMSVMATLGPIFLLTSFGLFKKSRKLDLLVTGSLAVSWGTYGYCFVIGYLDSLTFLPVPAMVGLVCCLTAIGIERYVCTKGVNAKV